MRLRFTYSVHFPELGKSERHAMWRKLREKRGLEARHSEEGMQSKAGGVLPRAGGRYGKRAQACRAPCLSGGKRLCLRGPRIPFPHDAPAGRPYRAASPESTTGYSSAGVCTARPVEDIVRQVATLDALMRAGAKRWSAGSAPCFSTPPGTGNAALARHFAESIDGNAKSRGGRPAPGLRG